MSIILKAREKLKEMISNDSLTSDILIEMISSAAMYRCIFFGNENYINIDTGILSVELCEAIHKHFDNDECIIVSINTDGRSVSVSVILENNIDKLSS